MKNEPIYKTAQIYETPQYRFVPRTGSVLMQILQQCNDLASRDTRKRRENKNKNKIF